ncbi:hypothetical protein AB1K70_17015 [Bremerella sp. JC770]|uniref:hypothetical protein n=1 Tax=Bremerella sp. JC770 TaxID=3232137 RepID=UPI003459C008
MTTTATKIGRRTALWRALGQEMQRRHRLGLLSTGLDHNALANQIAMAGYCEALWTHESDKLASLILDQPYTIPEDDEIYELELSICYRELAPDWAEELDSLVEAMRRPPMIGRFQGKPLEF